MGYMQISKDLYKKGRFSFSMICLYIIIIHVCFRYNVMKACWNFVPDERPGFALLVTTIGQQLTKPIPFEKKRSEIYLPMH